MDIINKIQTDISSVFSNPPLPQWSFANIIYVALLIVVTAGLILFVKLILEYLTSHHRIRAGRAHSIYQLSKYGLFVLALFLLLQILGIDLGVFLAGFAIIIFAIGLGLQQLFNDVMFGIIFLFDGSVQKNDIIMFEDGRDTVARVKKVGIRVSYVETKDNIVILIPNSQFSSGKVINLSHTTEVTRFIVEVKVAYSTDVNKAIDILKQIAIDHKDIRTSPTPLVHVVNFGDSSIDLELKFWSDNPFEIDNTLSEVRLSIIEEFRIAGITIPFPQHDVHMSNTI